MKKLINISMVLLIGIFLLTGCDNKEKEKGKEENKQPEVQANTNEDVIKDQSLGNFKFENTSLIYENGNSTLQTLVTNTGSTIEYLKEFKIHVKDAEGNEIIEMTGFIGGSLKPNESRMITSVYGEDLTKAASISYELVRE